MTTATEQITLTPAEIRAFHDNGVLGPFTLCSPEEMQTIREQIDRDVLTRPGPDAKRAGADSQFLQSRHLDCPVIWELASHPAIVERMRAAYGPDLVLWRTHLFLKAPGGKEVPWHQDLAYWPLEPLINISAWIAIDETTVDNGCLEVIPGSHKHCLPSVRSPEGMLFPYMTDPKSFDASKAVPVCMKPGQFILFNEKTLHHSHVNRSQTRRLGLAVRVTIPLVRVNHDELFPGHHNIQLCGEDRMGFNRLGPPPVA